MKLPFFLIAVAGGFVAWEAYQGLSSSAAGTEAGAATEAANGATASTPVTYTASAGGVSLPNVSASSVLGLIPGNWLNGLFNSESSLGVPSPTNPAPAYGIGSGYGAGSGGSGCWNSSAGGEFCGPKFTSIEEANGALASVLSAPRYQGAISFLEANPGNCEGFFSLLAQEGYEYVNGVPANAAQGAEWANGVCSGA